MESFQSCIYCNKENISQMASSVARPVPSQSLCFYLVSLHLLSVSTINSTGKQRPDSHERLVLSAALIDSFLCISSDMNQTFQLH